MEPVLARDRFELQEQRSSAGHNGDSRMNQSKVCGLHNSRGPLILWPPLVLASTVFSLLLGGCTAASPVTASLKDLTVPAMVGPPRTGPQRERAATPFDAEIRNSYFDSPLVMRPGQNSNDNPGKLGWEVLKAVPQCTQCTIWISRLPVGSYTTTLPIDLFYWYNKNWCGIEATAYNQGPRPGTGVTTNGRR